MNDGDDPYDLGFYPGFLDVDHNASHEGPSEPREFPIGFAIPRPVLCPGKETNPATRYCV